MNTIITATQKIVGLSLIFFATVSNAGMIKLVDEIVHMELNLGIDIPAIYEVNYGIQDWHFSEEYTGPGLVNPRVYGEKFYGRLPGQDESTFITGSSEFTHNPSFSTHFLMKTFINPNNEPNPGRAFGSAFSSWRLVFDVEGEGINLEVISSGFGTTGLTLLDISSGHSYEFNEHNILDVNLIDGHRYELYTFYEVVTEDVDGEFQTETRFYSKNGQDPIFVVPEPGSLALLMFGFLGLLYGRTLQD